MTTATAPFASFISNDIVLFFPFSQMHPAVQEEPDCRPALLRAAAALCQRGHRRAVHHRLGRVRAGEDEERIYCTVCVKI